MPEHQQSPHVVPPIVPEPRVTSIPVAEPPQETEEDKPAAQANASLDVDQSKRKTISPINDLSSNKPKIEELLKKEEEKEQVAEIVGNATGSVVASDNITPKPVTNDSPVSTPKPGSNIDPNSVAL
jgi:hypothetical protein